MRDHLPDEVKTAIARGQRLEYWTLFWLATIVVVMYLATGSSQAMKTAWIEDCLSLIPPILFILSSKIERREPTHRFPYGFHRLGSLAFFGAACALVAMGGYLLVNSAITIVKGEHPTIGTVSFFGRHVWLGWLMIPALLYSVVPPMILGRMKRPLARQTSDKILYTDADMNSADWQTGAAGAIGIVGVAFGFWWADSAAAALISLSILKDGLKNSRAATAELLDGAPRTIGSNDISEAAENLAGLIKEDDRLETRVRETGRYMRAVIAPKGGLALPKERGSAVLGDDYWRFVEISIAADCPTDMMDHVLKIAAPSGVHPADGSECMQRPATDHRSQTARSCKADRLDIQRGRE